MEAIKEIKTNGRNKMNTNTRELSRVKQDNNTGLWVVEILSPIGQWIVQGEWDTEQQANQDRKNWL